MKTLFACASALVLLTTAQAAHAQSQPEVAYNIGVVTDYVFRGFSQSDEDPAFQGGIDVGVDGFYAGGWASTVDFGDGTDGEVDIYGGYRTQLAGLDVDIGAVAYLYVGQPGAADYDYIELKAAASRAIGPATVGVVTYYSPDFFGVDEEAFYAEVKSSFSLGPSLTASGALGHQSLDVTDDYATWNVGLTYAFPSLFSLDVRYHDTDTTGPLGEERVVAMISAAF
jgi:uncharacterized protein (TIGR02001 family)